MLQAACVISTWAAFILTTFFKGRVHAKPSDIENWVRDHLKFNKVEKQDLGTDSLFLLLIHLNFIVDTVDPATLPRPEIAKTGEFHSVVSTRMKIVGWTDGTSDVEIWTDTPSIYNAYDRKIAGDMRASWRRNMEQMRDRLLGKFPELEESAPRIPRGVEVNQDSDHYAYPAK